MLRASIEETGTDYGLDGIAGDGDGGIPDGGVLIEFAEAVIGTDDQRLARARENLVETLGPAAFVDAAGVVANYNAMDRIADSTGTPLEEDRVEPSADMRAQLGIDRFPSATDP